MAAKGALLHTSFYIRSSRREIPPHSRAAAQAWSAASSGWCPEWSSTDSELRTCQLGFAELSAVNHTVSTVTSSNPSVIPWSERYHGRSMIAAVGRAMAGLPRLSAAVQPAPLFSTVPVHTQQDLALPSAYGARSRRCARSLPLMPRCQRAQRVLLFRFTCARS
jgi:hypothetical protein